MADLPKYPGVYPRGDKIRIFCKVDGQPYWETLNLTPSPRNLSTAKRIRKDKIDALKYGALSAADTDFFGYCQTFLNESACSFSTLDDYKNILNNIWVPALGHLNIDQIKRRHIKAALREMDCSDKTKENRLQPLSGVFKIAIEDEVIEVNPALGIQLKTKAQKKKSQYDIDPILPEEWGQLYPHIPDRSKAYFHLVYETGMRSPCEITALTWDDVLENGTKLAITKGIVRARHKDSTKTGVDRTILLSENAQSIVRQLPSRFKGEGPLFPTQKGEHHMDPKTFRRHWSKAIEASGVRPRRSYNLRHSFACRSLSAGADPNWLADYLGHNLVTLTTNYGKWIPSDKDEKELAKLNALL